jgi:hypothetical protein
MKAVLVFGCLILMLNLATPPTDKSAQAELRWIDDNGKSLTCLDTFLNILFDSEKEGLMKVDYHAAKIKNLLVGIESVNDPTLKKIRILEVNNLLDQDFFRYFTHLYAGRADVINGNTLKSSKLSKLNLRDSLKKIKMYGSVKTMLDGIRCRYYRYGELKSILSGCLNERIQYPLKNNSDILHNENLIVELKINMERCRWMPENLSDTLIEVNIPEFKLRLMKVSTVVFESNVIVGQKKHQSPVIYSKLNGIVFNPFWHVPFGIANRDIWPKVKKNKSYLKQHHYKVTKTSYKGKIVYRIIQDPGPWNSLGLIKFEFPNSKTVFIHDTPYKDLFNKKIRTLSNGCIRLQRPAKLASILTGKDSIDLPIYPNMNKIHQMSEFKYPGNCDVLLLYITIARDENDFPLIFDDVYGKNNEIKFLFSNSTH